MTSSSHALAPGTHCLNIAHVACIMLAQGSHLVLRWVVCRSRPPDLAAIAHPLALMNESWRCSHANFVCFPALNIVDIGNNSCAHLRSS